MILIEFTLLSASAIIFRLRVNDLPTVRLKIPKYLWLGNDDLDGFLHFQPSLAESHGEKSEVLEHCTMSKRYHQLNLFTGETLLSEHIVACLFKKSQSILVFIGLFLNRSSEK